MMSDVQIVITREIARITRQGFGKPLIFHVGDDVDYADCRNLDEVSDSFAATTDVYSMAAAIFAQNPSPNQIAVAGADVEESGEAPSAVVENTAGTAMFSVTADPDQEEGETNSEYNGVKVVFIDDGEEGTLEVTHETDPDEIVVNFRGSNSVTCQEIVDAIDDETTGLDSFSAEVVDGTGAVAFVAEDSLEIVAVLSGGYDNKYDGIKVKLAELIGDRNDWYFLLTDERDIEFTGAFSEVAAGNKKLFFTSPDASVANCIAKAKALNSNRTSIWYHPLAGGGAGGESDPWLDAAVVGRCAPTDPGSITWKFKQLMGVPVADVTTTQINDLHSANVNTFISKLGVAQTSEGYTTQGEYIDIARGADWVEARMSERVHYLLFTNPKVPFDNRGIGMVKGEVEAVLQWATTRGIVAVDNDGNGMFEVTVPDRADTDPVDRANRILKDVRFEFDLAGAIHEVRIAGVIRI